MNIEDKVLVEIAYEKFLLPSSEVQKFTDLMKKMIRVRQCWDSEATYYKLEERNDFSISNATYEVRKGQD